MEYFWLVLQWFFLSIIGLQVLYFFIFSLASTRRRTKKTVDGAADRKKIAVLIPGYKEDRVIVNTAREALRQDYPQDKYRVVVLADSFSAATLAELAELPIEVLEVSFESSTKAKSLNKGMAYLAEDPPELVVVLDSDNIMATDFLSRVNQSFSGHRKVVQGHRTAKNQDSPFALLDAINEEIGNSIFRRGHRALGMSSSLIGSAMAFDYYYFHHLLHDIHDVAGEDKLLELKIMKAGEKVEYLEDAYVYDEKVANGPTFAKQRTRWVGVQLYFLRHYFLDGVKELLLRGKLDYFNKTFQMALIPKVLLIGLLAVTGLISALGWLHPLWWVLALLYFAALLLAVPRRFFDRRLASALLHIPQAIVFMILGILRIRRSTASKFEVTDKGV